MLQKELFASEIVKGTSADPYAQLLPAKIRELDGPPPVTWWEIPHTIKELAYLTHDYFRYYGKFPSTVASQLLEDYPAPKNGVLVDNFMGSGTSLVEASRRGIQSVGFDINPLAVLAGQVKTRVYDPLAVSLALEQVVEASRSSLAKGQSLPSADIPLPSDSVLNKWFLEDATQELASIKTAIIEIAGQPEREFLTLAFLAIIRRVSKAFDGEVRPHINKAKRPRSPISAFVKKVRDMLARQEQFNRLYPNRVPANAVAADCTQPLETIPKGNVWLVISHPPYLNCFDYLPVFSLETAWMEGFDSLQIPMPTKMMRQAELKAWPATNPDFVQRYYDRLTEAYTRTHEIQRAGGRLAVVIGDCTIKGKLERVHEKCVTAVEQAGYSIESINFRTTHYATGKYSYEHRAEYHGDKSEKRDAILVFRK